MDRVKLLEELMLDEGIIHEIYNDHLGFATFGVGHLITESDEEWGQPLGTPVSEQRVKDCLNADVDIVCKELDKNLQWWRGLNDTRQRVLANMCFNLGGTRLSKFRNMLKACREHDWAKMAVEMEDSRWFKQVGRRSIELQKQVLECCST